LLIHLEFFSPQYSIEPSSTLSASAPSPQTVLTTYGGSSIAAATPATNQSSAALTARMEGLAKVGNVIKQGAYELTVNGVETAGGGHIYNDDLADSTGRMVYVDLTIDSNADRGVSVNTLYTRLKDPDGFTYQPTYSLVKQNLASVNDVAKGDRVRGWVAFKVPSLKDSYVFEYQPLTFGTKVLLKVELDISSQG